jgi:hypothetical protein
MIQETGKLAWFAMPEGNRRIVKNRWLNSLNRERGPMKLSKEDLLWSAEQGLITKEQALRLWEALDRRKQKEPKFDLTHVLYYLGAFVVMGALGWLMNDAWTGLGGGALAVLACMYGLGFILAGRKLWHGQGLLTPGGILFTLAVWMTPLAVFGLQQATGWWLGLEPGAYRDYYQWIKGGWFFMEAATIAAGLIALWFVKFPFLTFPIAFALWFMSMDLTPLIYGQGQGWQGDPQKIVSMIMGAAMIAGAYLVDRRTREDYAFWGYLFGMAAFWGGLSLLDSHSELGRLIYGLINLGFIGIAVLFQRQVFLVFGAVGLFGYLAHLSFEVFRETMLFPVVLAGVGVLMIYGGVKYQKKRQSIQDGISRVLPGFLIRMLPPHRGG